MFQRLKNQIISRIDWRMRARLSDAAETATNAMRHAAYRLAGVATWPHEHFTDYPIRAFGDVGNRGPMRRCRLISCDLNKYCWVEVENWDPVYGTTIKMVSVHRCRVYTVVKPWMDPVMFTGGTPPTDDEQDAAMASESVRPS